MMKKASVVIFDHQNDTVVTDQDLKLPTIEFDEQQISGFDAAVQLLDSFGLDACMFSMLYSSEDKEIWQALSYIDKLDWEGEAEIKQWTSTSFIDCELHLKWVPKIIGNIPKVIPSPNLPEKENNHE